MNNEMAVIAIVLPPFDTQQAIAAFLDKETAEMDTLVTETESVIEFLKELHSALGNNAVTGKINVER
jgi:type I restriction enzyme S subunit